MSDGPHRSLPMRKAWKKLAERGDGKLHTADQVRDAVPLALADDWRFERCDNFMKQVRDVLLGTEQNTLFEPSREQMADAIRNLPGSGQPLRGILAATIAQAVEDGYSAEAAMLKGTADGFAIKCSAGARQVEEHYLRASSERRAVDVRTRIEDGAARSDFDSMAHQFCKVEKAASANKYDGLDEGVRIR
jgi:hypothetical protein